MHSVINSESSSGPERRCKTIKALEPSPLSPILYLSQPVINRHQNARLLSSRYSGLHDHGHYSSCVSNLHLLSQLQLLKHISYAISTVSKQTQWSNANGRGESNVQHLKKTLPAAVFATYERAEAAHKNSFESMPLFIAATLSGVFAEKLTRTDVGNAQFSAIFLGIRALYTILYVCLQQS